jgi:hypothetical protein
MPAIAYFSWAVNYAMVNFYLAKSTIDRKGYQNTYQYFTEKPEIRRFLEKNGFKISPYVFLVVHFGLFALCHIMGMVCFHNFWFNTAVVSFFSIIGIWNGAVYYMEYFCKKYEK